MKNTRQFDHPLMRVDSIASWWLGLAGGEDSFNLETISFFLDGAPIAFKVRSSTDKQLMIQTERFPGTVPVAIAEAVLGLVSVRRSFSSIRVGLAGIERDGIHLVNSLISMGWVDFMKYDPLLASIEARRKSEKAEA